MKLQPGEVVEVKLKLSYSPNGANDKILHEPGTKLKRKAMVKYTYKNSRRSAINHRLERIAVVMFLKPLPNKMTGASMHVPFRRIIKK